VLNQYLGDPTFNNFINFANAHPDELIILTLSHCSERVYNRWTPDSLRGKGCFDDEFVRTFRDRGILHLNTMEGCSNGECLGTLTYGEAKNLAKQHGQQGIIALTIDSDRWDPVQGNWDSSVTRGKWNEWNNYLSNFLGRSAPRNQLRKLQAHWQGSGTDSAPSDAGFNCAFQDQLEQGEVPVEKLNLVSINWFCQGGKAIAEALGVKHLDQCNAECH